MKLRMVTEAEILKDVIAPGRGDLPAPAAKSLLDLKFSRTATSRIRSLLRANNRGALSATERVELEKYLRVGQLLDLLQAKARQTLLNRKAA
jgi:hypothetical protein